MRTREPPILAILRAPGGEPWFAEGVSVRDVLTSSVIMVPARNEPLVHAMRVRRPVVATSPRAAGWMADLPPSVPRGPVWCSGGRTARILASGGWEPIPPRLGSGGEAVAARILSETRGDVLHVCGAETAGTLQAALASEGRSVEPLVVYETRDRASFSDAEVDSLARCRALAVLAPSCLRVLVALQPDLARRLSGTVPALCGPTTAGALREFGWRDLRIAAEPSQEALLSMYPTRSVLPGGSR